MRWIVPMVWLAVAGTVFATGSPALAPPRRTPNEVFWDDYTLRYEAGFMKANSLVVSAPYSQVVYFDDASNIVPGYGCSHVGTDLTRVRCDRPNLVPLDEARLEIRLYDDNDWVNLADQYYETSISGESGNDVITFSATTIRNTFAYGGPGNDAMVRLGGAGLIRMQGGEGADIMCGVESVVDYFDHDTGVTASIGGVSGDDGSPGEGDTICDNVQGLFGTMADDVLTANGTLANVEINGTDGNDIIIGGSGNDYLIGSWGVDTIIGNAGDDYIIGGTEADTINAGSGHDLCVVRPEDSYSGCENTAVDSPY